MIQRPVPPEARGLGLILVDLKIAAEMIVLSIRLTEQGAPSPGILREAMERLEKIPPRIYDLLNGPKQPPSELDEEELNRRGHP